MFNPFHPLLIPPQPCIPTFFGKYANTPSADQSTSLSALTNNDLQIGIGTADHTGSNVNFAAANMKHVNGLAVVNLNGKTVPQTYYYDGNTGKASSVRAASTTTATVWPSVKFSSSTKPYSSSNTSSLKRYLAIVKPSTATTISTTATSGCEAWSLSYNVNQNTSSSHSVTSSRPGYYLGWGYSYKGAVETFTAPENANYKLEVWGAEGLGNPLSSNTSKGGLGGYSYGNISLSPGSPLYVCVGQRPPERSDNCPGGYNGGGISFLKNGHHGGGGGGATHIAQTSNLGVLANYSSHQDYVLIVAGGGGGSDDFEVDDGTGGYGGGTNGGNAYNNGTLITGSGSAGCGGSASSGYAFGQGGSSSNAPNDAGGGGGGWYGGYGGDGNSMGGGGGSGHIGTGVTGETIAGNTSFPSPSGGIETGHTGNGYAIITQVSY